MNANYDFLYERTAFYYNYLINITSDGEKPNHAVKYFNKRGIGLKTINKFMIGCTPCNNNRYSISLIKELKQHDKGYNIVGSRLAHLVEYKGYYIAIDFFGPRRIVVPIMQNGHPLYFTSRDISRDDGQWLHMANNTGNTIQKVFNQDILKSSCSEVYITEGIFDALSLEECGYNAIATLGTAGILPAYQDLFVDKDKNYIFVFDNDLNQAGDKAVIKSASVLKSFGCKNLYQIKLPRPKETKKIDINNLLIRANDIEKFTSWFKDTDRHILNVEAYHRPINDNKYTNTIPQVDIYRVISNYTPLERISPTCWRGICPLHNDTKPSLYVYTESNSFMCYGCQCGGDAAQFLEDMYDINYPEALNKLKEYTI